MDNRDNIPSLYKSCSLHIALERADLNKDWAVFKKLVKINPKFLKMHLDATSSTFDYNYLSLTKEQQYDLFN
jgi:hypothetical protein